MTPAQSQAIQDAMQKASAALDDEAVAQFGPVAADICAACADLANQMKFFVMIIDGDMTSYATSHAGFLARVIDGVADLAKVDRAAFRDMLLKLAETRLYVHDSSRTPNG
jgi:hypothetical protein